MAEASPILASTIMIRQMKFFCIVSIVLVGNTLAQTEDDYLTYRIPLDAKKSGPGPSRDPTVEYYTFYPSGEEPSWKNQIAREMFKGGQLVERLLYDRKGSKHGVQREWYTSGKPRSESPYKHGIMYGPFRLWGEAGRLTGQYLIIDGKGTQRLYSEDGELIREKEFENSKGNGILMEMAKDSATRSISFKRDDNVVGKAFMFTLSGKLVEITCYSSKGVWHGPRIVFTKDGATKVEEWFVDNQKVDKHDYAEAALVDSSLPPYFEDARRYKEFADPDVIAKEKIYRQMPRVKIPLEFDETNNPVLAP